jgi:Domain of unknown function (DUF4396)
MDMTTMGSSLPDWLTPVAWAFLALAVASAAAIAYDIYARDHRHIHLAAELVWVGSALYLGPIALALYARQGRTPAGTGPTVAGRREDDSGRPAAADALPGGTASAIAHVIGVPLVIASGLTIAGIDLWVMILVIAALAMALLFAYERASGMTGGVRVSLGAATAAAVLTVLAFDIGMGGWMLVLHFNELMPPATGASFWFLMQIGIVLGLITGYPAVAWLTRRRRTAALLSA